MATEIKYHTKENALTAVTQDGTELQWCSTKLKNNEDVVMTAIKQNSWAIEYASKALKSNKAFIMKALNENVYPWYLIQLSNNNIQSDTEVMTLAVEKSNNGFEFACAKGEASLNKELAAKAIVKLCNHYGPNDFRLWYELNHTLQEFFPKDGYYKKAQAYLHQFEQEKQAEIVSGGTKEEDEIVW